VKINIRREFELMYRASQLMHRWSMDVFKHLVPVLFIGAEFMIIMAMFACIRLGFSKQIILAILAFAIAVILFCVLMFALVLSSGITKGSAGYVDELVNAATSTKANKRFLISCPPLELRIGSTFTVTQQTFPTILQDVLIGNIINLLVTFK